jgi:excisionase family DNA binding protein
MVGMENTASTPKLTAIEPTTCTTCTPLSPAVMSVPEAARLIRCSKGYLYVGIREGRFPSVKTGRKRGLPMAFMRGFVADVIDRSLPMSFEDYARAWFERTAVAS